MASSLPQGWDWDDRATDDGPHRVAHEGVVHSVNASYRVRGAERVERSTRCGIIVQKRDNNHDGWRMHQDYTATDGEVTCIACVATGLP